MCRLPLIVLQILFVVSALLHPAAISASTHAEISKQANQLLNQITSTNGPGATVLIAQGDKIIFRKARGRANIELGVDLTPDQVFHIASVTKIFTAALILKLTETDLLSIDHLLSRYLPNFPNAELISIRQLLNHTAGISDRVPTNAAQPGFSRRDVELALLVTEIAKRPLNFAPGTNQAYSNSGYILLGAVIEKITGKKWHESLQERLLEPIGLKQTVYGAATAMIPGRVAGYTSNKQSQNVKNADFISMTIPTSAGALVSTADNLRNWMSALKSGKVIKMESYQKMITPFELPDSAITNSYGFGMYVWRVRGETLVGHTGQINGFASILAYLPSKDITIIVLANDDNFNARIVGRQLAAIALGKPYPAHHFIRLNTNQMQELVGRYEAKGADVRIFSIIDGKLHAKRGDRNAIPIQITANSQLHYEPSELSYFLPIRDLSGLIVRLDYFDNGDGPPLQLMRVNEANIKKGD
jgi:D-alanyl-D-alanine carboxypeptidase